MAKLRIEQTWDGKALGPEEAVEVEFFLVREHLVVLVDSYFFGDKAPIASRGSTDRLWEYEVVELFLAGGGSRYLEIELGPHGHYLTLQLEGVRQVVDRDLPMEYEAEISGRRWRGVARVPVSYLPPGVNKANAYAIHGEDEERRYLAAFPLPGHAPDFHQLDSFREIKLDSHPSWELKKICLV
jgi:hypothetical protein